MEASKLVGNKLSAIDYPPESIPLYGEPVVETLQSLISASRAGNYRASCRLATSIRRCEVRSELFGVIGQLTGERQKYERRLVANISIDDPKIKSKQIELQRNEQAWANMCRGFEASMAKPAWYYQYAAAMQGHIPSMVNFAFAPAIADYGAFNIINPSDKLGWDFYEHDAALMLRRAADLGNLKAIQLLSSAFSGRQNLGERGVLLASPDAYEAAKYALVYRNLASEKGAVAIEKTLSALRKKLSADEMIRAESEALLLSAQLSKSYIDKQLKYPEIRYGDGDQCTHD